MGRASRSLPPPFHPLRLFGFGFLLLAASAAPASWIFLSLQLVERLSAPAQVAPDPGPVLKVLVRPELDISRPTHLLDREIARGVAELVGRRAELVFEFDPVRRRERLLAGEVDLVANLPVTSEEDGEIAFTLPYGSGSGPRPAVAVRPENAELLRAANEFLIARALLGPEDPTYTDDLEGIRERGTLRVLTVRSPSSYFMHGGEQRGFEFELMRRFAGRHELRVEVVVPPSRADLVPWLLEGRGDVVAAGLTVTPELTRAVAFTRPYQNTQEVVVVRESARVDDLDDLRGRTVYVREGSAHHETLRELRLCDDDFAIELVPESVTPGEIFDHVEDGTWDATVCDSHVLEMECAFGRGLRAAFPIKAVRHAWATRPGSPALREALDQFLRSEYRGLHFNVIHERYFESARAVVAADDEYRSDVSGRISPWDDLIRRYAAEQGLDWRLVAAQMYQESQFDESRVSPAGAAGLMQIMPGTARDLGLEARHDPDESIRAGTAYLRTLIDQFDPELPLATRIRFALASYNAGSGHVQDARRLAARLGWSPDEWYGSVERALLLLQRPEYYRDARHGYCRAHETVLYVKEIDRRYRAYVEHVPVGFAALPEEDAPEPGSRGG